jgi:endonuclease III
MATVTRSAQKPPQAALRTRRRDASPGAITGKSIGRVLAILRRESRGWNAPVLTLMAAEKHDPFLTLIGCILSLRTNDKTTAIAAPRLFAKARTPV